MEDTMFIFLCIIWICSFAISIVQLVAWLISKGAMAILINVLRSISIWWYIENY